jgi:hypothetical protein
MKSLCVRLSTFRKSGVFAAVISLASLGFRPQVAAGQAGAWTLLPDGTPVHLILMDDLQGKQLQLKQTVRFKVREDLIINSIVIIKTGADAFAHVESVSKSGLFGKSGRLALRFDYVESASGTKITLRGGAGINGGKGGALTWESALWYGPNASLPVGTVINAYVDHDQRVAGL